MCLTNFTKKLLFHRKVLIDENHIGWIGIKFPLLEKELLRSGLKSIYFKLDPLTSTQQVQSQTESMSDAIYYLVCNKLECQKKEVNFYDDDFVETSAATAYANFALMQAQRVIEEIQPSTVLFVQGYIMESAALRSICIEKSIPFIALENTGRYDRILWDDFSGITVNCNLSKNYFWRLRDHISLDEINSYHEKYIKNQKLFKSMEHKSPSHTYINPDDRPLLTWLGQVYTDSSVLFGLNPGLSTPIECIRALLLFAYDHNCRVFLKMHPKEYIGKNFIGNPYNRLTARRIREDPSTFDFLTRLGDNVILDDNNYFDTYSVIENSTLTATINSQAGLESAIRGVPVLLCGNAFYSGLGFTKEANTEREVYAKIAELLDSGVDLSFTEEARRFNYIFFEKYCIPKSAASITSLVANSINYRKIFYR